MKPAHHLKSREADSSGEIDLARRIDKDWLAFESGSKVIFGILCSDISTSKIKKTRGLTASSPSTRKNIPSTQFTPASHSTDFLHPAQASPPPATAPGLAE